MKKILLSTLALAITLVGCTAKSNVNRDAVGVNSNVNTSGSSEYLYNQEYTSAEYGFQFILPEGWKMTMLESGSLGLMPADKNVDKQFGYVGDIVVKVYRNPDGLDARSAYAQNNTEFNIFENASPRETSIGSYKTYFFDDFPGNFSSDIYVVEAGDLVLQFSAINEMGTVAEGIIASIQN